MGRATWLLVLGVCAAGCDDSIKPDAAADLTAPDDLAPPPDLSSPPDLAVADLIGADLAGADLSTPDLFLPDLFLPDTATSADGAVVGGFKLATAVPYAVGPQSFIVAGDFDGDGKQDIAASPVFDSTMPAQSLRVLIGSGTGTFGAPVASGTVPGGPLVAGRFNADNRSDVAVAGTNSVLVLLSTGSGVFANATPFLACGGATGVTDCPNALCIGDMNADNNLDLVVVTQSSSGPSRGAIHTLIGTGTGNFAATLSDTPLTGGMSRGGTCAIARLGMDANTDVAVVENFIAGPPFVGGRGLSVAGNGDGTFQTPALAGPGSGIGIVNSVAAGDLGNDGRADLVLVDRALSVLRNTGTSFAAPVSYGVGGSSPCCSTAAPGPSRFRSTISSAASRSAWRWPISMETIGSTSRSPMMSRSTCC